MKRDLARKHNKEEKKHSIFNIFTMQMRVTFSNKNK